MAVRKDASALNKSARLLGLARVSLRVVNDGQESRHLEQVAVVRGSENTCPELRHWVSPSAESSSCETGRV